MLNRTLQLHGMRDDGKRCIVFFIRNFNEQNIPCEIFLKYVFQYPLFRLPCDQTRRQRKQKCAIIAGINTKCLY